MTAPHEVERCPQCRHGGYVYDAVCKLWCCGQCHGTETVDEKRRREARAGGVSEMRRKVTRARPAHKAGHQQHPLALRARHVS